MPQGAGKLGKKKGAAQTARKGHSQALKKKAKNCKGPNFVIYHLRRHKAGFRLVQIPHRLCRVGFADVAFKALVGKSTCLALRGLAAIFMEDDCADKL